MTTSTRVGCELVIINSSGEILLGERGPTAYGPGTWALPGGHLEYGERLDICICREMQEELELTITPADIEFQCVSEHFLTDQHYVHVTFRLKTPLDTLPTIKQPEHAQLQFFALDDLPESLFPPHHTIFRTLQAKVEYLPKS